MQATSDTKSANPNIERRIRVVGDLVACRRIGLTTIGRCDECVYLVRAGKGHIVCLDDEIAEEAEFRW